MDKTSVDAVIGGCLDILNGNFSEEIKEKVRKIVITKEYMEKVDSIK
ncbi:hypothetical protein BhaS171_00022 [Bacillus phage vB_BhaS-171]|nr:hypothetical protein BH781_gp22 [Bacillus phage vB_BhaS-171]ALY08078.1 hypothetical protein BhaS171_00022 [Bacillus phage vB_BhaS-171]